MSSYPYQDILEIRRGLRFGNHQCKERQDYSNFKANLFVQLLARRSFQIFCVLSKTQFQFSAKALKSILEFSENDKN